MKLGRTVGELEQTMSSAELTEWLAYNEIDPIGEERADYRSALIAQVIANSNRDAKKPAYKIEDFMPQFESEDLSPEDEYNRMALAFGLI